MADIVFGEFSGLNDSIFAATSASVVSLPMTHTATSMSSISFRVTSPW